MDGQPAAEVTPMPNRTVSVRLAADVANYVNNVGRNAVKATKDLNAELAMLGKDHREKFNQLTTAAGGVGLALAGGFALVAKSAADFDKQMSAVAAVSNSSAQSLGELRDAALKAGKDTAFSATEAARAEEELAKAGISTGDILSGALTGALSLASAGSLDLADASTIAAQAMNIFGLQGKDVGHIADVLAAGANKSAADVNQLGLSLRQGGLVAAQTGLSLEETVGVLSAFADRGLVASDAGTSLKSMLQAIQAPSKISADLMAQLGIHAYDAQGKFVGLAAFAQNLRDSLGHLTQAERDHAFAQIFGSDATRAASIIYNQGADGIKDYTRAVNDNGAAAETARKKMDNLAGDVEQLRGSLETLTIRAGSGANQGLRALTQAATGTVNAFLDLPGPIQETVTILAGVSGAGLLAATGFVKARQTGQAFLDNLREMGPAGGKAATALEKVGSVGGKLALAGVAAVGLYEGMRAFDDWLDARSKPMSLDIERLTDDLRFFAETGLASGQMLDVFGANLSKLSTLANRARFVPPKPLDMSQQTVDDTTNLSGMVEWTAQQERDRKQAIEDIHDLDKALAEMAGKGGATQAKLAFDQITQSLRAQGMPLSEINSMFGEYNKAASDAALANSRVALGFGDVAQNATTMNLGLQDAIDHGQKLTDVFKQLNGAALDLLGSQVQEEQALADLTTKWDKHGNALALNTQAGRDNLKLVQDGIKGAIDAAQAKLNESGSLQSATQAYDAYIGRLRDALIKQGVEKAKVDEIIGTYARMPPLATTKIEAIGADTVLSRSERINNEMDKLNGRRSTSYVDVITRDIRIRLDDPSNFGHINRWGGVYTHAAEGALRQAAVYSTASPARYAYAEPATGGEAFVPRFGDYTRSTAILDQAARWYGGSFTPGGIGGGGGAATVVNLTVYAGMGTDGNALGQQIAEKLRPYVNSLGGNVQFALGRRGQ
jgi:TP901 family phage tail tape measure protein